MPTREVDKKGAKMDLFQDIGVKLCCILVISLLVLGLNPQPSAASTDSSGLHIGIGGKFIPIMFEQKAFYPNLNVGVGNVGVEHFGVELGGNFVNFQHDDSYTYNSVTYSVSTNASLNFYLANIKYYFRNHGLIRPRLGVGVVNMGLNGHGKVTSNQNTQEFDVSANIGAYNFQFGIDLPLKSFNIPLVLVAGINHYYFHGLNVEASMTGTYESKIEEAIEYGLNFFHYHFGLRYEF